jgi:predicted PurR-regulated permease PerM
MDMRADRAERDTDGGATAEGPSRKAGEEPPSSVAVGAPVTPPGQQPSRAGERTPGPDHARVALVLVGIVVMVGVVTYLGPILKPFLVAMFLYFATKGAAGFLIRRGFPVLLAYLTLFAAGSAAVAAVALLTYGEALSFRAQWPQYQQRILAVIGEAPGKARQPLSELFTAWSAVVYRELFERGVALVELLVMTFFYLLFILFGVDRVPRRVRRAFPGGRGEQVVAVAEKIGAAIGRFMQVKTVVSIGMGVSAAVLMGLFGLRGWLLWGVLFFALNYITYIGSLIACVPPVVLAYLDLGSPIAATALAVLVVVNRFVWIDFLEVKMAGRHLNIDSILLFLWLAYWGWVWGVVGLVLAFPMVASLKIVLEHVEATKGWAVVMGDD